MRVSALGKKGSVSLMMRELGKMSPEERQVMGPALNGLKTRLNDAIEARKADLETAALNAALASETVDVSLPVRPEQTGTLHPITQVMEELAVIFADMGFAVAEGPDVEDDFHNFTALNFPEGHPARDTQDTFFMKPDAEGMRKVLRTHTSPVQIRTMLKGDTPIRIIAPGRVYRCDWDQTHTPMFHQVEGLVIDKETIWVTSRACCWTSSRPSSRPIRSRLVSARTTSPSPNRRQRWMCAYERVGEAVKVGLRRQMDWKSSAAAWSTRTSSVIAVLDPDEYQGFAFGMGVDRLAMLKYGAPDLRDFFNSDVRWLAHYGFSPLLQANLATGLS